MGQHRQVAKAVYRILQLKLRNILLEILYYRDINFVICKSGSQKGLVVVSVCSLSANTYSLNNTFVSDIIGHYIGLTAKDAIVSGI